MVDIIGGSGQPNFNQSFQSMGTPTKLCVIKEGITHLMRGQMLIMTALLETKGVTDGTKEKLRQWVNPEGNNQEGSSTGREASEGEGHQ